MKRSAYTLCIAVAVSSQSLDAMDQAVPSHVAKKVKRNVQFKGDPKELDISQQGVYHKQGRYEKSAEHKQFEKGLIKEQEHAKEERVAAAAGEARNILVSYARQTLDEVAGLEKTMVKNTYKIWQLFQDYASIGIPKEAYAQLSAALKANGDALKELNDYRGLLNEYKNNAGYDDENPIADVQDLENRLGALTTMDGYETINPQVIELYKALLNPKIEAKLAMVKGYDRALVLVKMYRQGYEAIVNAIQHAMKEAALEGALGGMAETITEKIDNEFAEYLRNKALAEWEILSDILLKYAPNKTRNDIEEDFPQ